MSWLHLELSSWYQLCYVTCLEQAAYLNYFFCCFTANTIKRFHVLTAPRKKGRLILFNAVPTGRPKPLANAAMETPSVLTVDAIRPVSIAIMILLNRFIFLIAGDSIYLGSLRCCFYQWPENPRENDLSLFTVSEMNQNLIIRNLHTS